MLSLPIIFLFTVLAIVLLDGNWRDGLLVTVAIGFLQDPIRKITPNQPSTLSGMVLLAFLFCLLVMYERNGGNFRLRQMFWTIPAALDWIPLYFGLIAIQAVNSYFRFGDLQLTGLGVAFYFAPAVALWAGFQAGNNPQVLRRIIITYLVFCFLFSITAFLDFRGLRGPLMREVGEGILITFEGFSAQGVSGFWRTSEIAGWHLAAGCCLSITLAFSSRRRESQIFLLLLAGFFAYLTIPTGRRKSLVMTLAFSALYLLLFSRKATAASRERVISSLIGSTAMAYAGYALFLISAKGDSFDIYLNRVLTAKDDIFERFQGQGIGALQRGLEISQGFGLGVGAGANLGNIKISSAAQAQRGSIQSLSYASEGGGGRILSELGLPGLVIGGGMALVFFLSLWKNFLILERLPNNIAFLLLGLLSFGLANILFFVSAGQVYSDPFVLIMMGLCFGSFLAVPSLIARHQLETVEVAASR
jgi:hypothetical protein